ncbi:hypothetical protein GF342_03030 [Candidatus Woesearchaeota archaeon]|nr:hypothetical protein [Candidatus Woesearchaeota archaeon]
MHRLPLHTVFSRLRERFEEACLDPLVWKERIVRPGDPFDHEVVQRAQEHMLVLQLLANFHYTMYESFQEVDEQAQEGHATDFYVSALDCADKARNYGLLISSSYLKDVTNFVSFPKSIWTTRKIETLDEWNEEMQWLNGTIHRDRLQPLSGWQQILRHDLYQNNIMELETLLDHCRAARTKI